MLEDSNTCGLMFWGDQNGGGRNVFCIFERTVAIESALRAASVRIFADSLYRLIVNGQILGYGPARFHPSWPEYDSHDIREALVVGENLIRIEVNSRGVGCFQAVPGRGGLAVAGEIDGQEIGLPEEWSVRHSRAWDGDSESYSFAQGPVEICNTLELQNERNVRYPPTAVSGQSHWGRPSPRAIAPPSLEIIRPSLVTKACLLKGGFVRVGFRCPLVEGGRQPFYTHIFSPHEQEVEAGASWGPVGMHGKWLGQTPCPQRSSREIVWLPLRKGWNFLYGMPEILKPDWVWMLEIPDFFGLKIQGRPETANQAPFCVGAPAHGKGFPDEPPRCSQDLPGFPVAWPAANANRRPPSPAREMAWDVPSAEIAFAGPAWTVPITFPAGGDSTIVLDMGGEFLGHAFFEVEAPAGTILDVGYEERLRSDGFPDHYRCNPFVNSADRFILHGGRQRIEGFHERGGRYLQATFRDARGPVKLLDAGIRSSCGRYPTTGRFCCGDPDLDWAWEAGDRTLRASMADGWIDPWRERGLYIGDALVQGHATRKITNDWRLDPWCLRLWARSQFDNGQLPDVVPSYPHRPLCDYTLIWIIALRNYWAASGDSSLVGELWPAIPRIFSSPVWKSALCGLWEVTPATKIFVDWGVVLEEREGVNAALNAFRIRALECAAELAQAVGRHGEADVWKLEACTLAQMYRKTFWVPSLGRFTAAVISGSAFSGPALHANALALAFGICDSGQQVKVANYLVDGLKISGGLPEGHLELYFLYYALDGLYRAGRAREAENAIRDYYGFMRQRGAWTLWETLREGMEGKDSLCHGWSSGAIPYLAERVLGVRPAVAGDPSRILVAPEAETIDKAEGCVPHPAGPIMVRWAATHDRLQIEVQKPSGVEVEICPQGRLGALVLETISITTI